MNAMLVAENHIAFGFTGTRNGMTVAQRKTFRTLITVWDVQEFHHGDCIGADAEAHGDISSIKPKAHIVLHPPDNVAARAWCPDATHTMPSLPFLKRNQMIVRSCTFLIAAPGESKEQQRSGTWATVRYARKVKREMIIVYPDGSYDYA